MTNSEFAIPLWARVISEADGILGVTEFADLPFTPQRFFWLSAIDGDAIRADHAHRTCHQMLICLSGSITATVTTAINMTVVHAMSVGMTVHLPPLNWLVLTDFSDDAVLGVLASEPYDGSEYIISKHELNILWSSAHSV